MRAREIRWCLLLLSVSLLVASRRAWAEPPERAAPFSVRLEYAVPDGCPAVDVFENAVSKRLGYTPFSEHASARVQVLVTRGDIGTEGLLAWRDNAGNSTGEQTFPSRSNDCAELVAALGFALAVQVQLLAATEPAGAPAPSATPTSQPAEKKPEIPEPTQPATPASSSRAVARTPVSVVAGGGVGLGIGMMTQTALLARLFGAVVWPRVTLELAAETSLPETTHRADGAGYSQRNVLGSAAGCGVHERWSACLVMRAGAVHVAGQSIDAPQSASAALVQTGLRIAVKQRLWGGAYLSARGEGLANWTRWSVTLDHLPVWTSPRLAYLGGLDFGVLLF